jgi:hypothetical protein
MQLPHVAMIASVCDRTISFDHNISSSLLGFFDYRASPWLRKLLFYLEFAVPMSIHVFEDACTYYVNLSESESLFDQQSVGQCVSYVSKINTKFFF